LPRRTSRPAATTSATYPGSGRITKPRSSSCKSAARLGIGTSTLGGPRTRPTPRGRPRGYRRRFPRSALGRATRSVFTSPLPRAARPGVVWTHEMTATKIDRGLVTRNTAAGLLRHRRHFLEIGAVRNPLGDFDIVLRLDGRTRSASRASWRPSSAGIGHGWRPCWPTRTSTRGPLRVTALEPEYAGDEPSRPVDQDQLPRTHLRATPGKEHDHNRTSTLRLVHRR